MAEDVAVWIQLNDVLAAGRVGDYWNVPWGRLHRRFHSFSDTFQSADDALGPCGFELGVLAQ
jgi:hypothetical protein